MERGDLEYVKWEDPTSQSQWMDSDDIDEFMNDKTFVAESVGWIVKEDDSAIVIAATVNVPDTYVGQTFRIPKSAILVRVNIREFIERQTS